MIIRIHELVRQLVYLLSSYLSYKDGSLAHNARRREHGIKKEQDAPMQRPWVDKTNIQANADGVEGKKYCHELGRKGSCDGKAVFCPMYRSSHLSNRISIMDRKRKGGRRKRTQFKTHIPTSTNTSLTPNRSSH